MKQNDLPSGSVLYLPYHGVIKAPIFSLLLLILAFIIGLDNLISGFFIAGSITLLYPTFNSFNAKRILNTTIALGEGHPFREDSSSGKADVYVSDHTGEWKKLGEKRFRLHKDEILDLVNLIEDGDEYGVEFAIFSSKTIGGVHKQCLSYINAALAYRDAYLGKDDSIEDARERESTDSTLLEREWPEEEELLEPGLRSFRGKDE